MARRRATVQDVIQPVAGVTSRRRLRSASSSALVVPATHRSMLGDRVFAVAGPRAWNSLPEFITARHLSPPRNISRLIYLVYLFIACIDCVKRCCSSLGGLQRYNFVKLHYVTRGWGYSSPHHCSVQFFNVCLSLSGACHEDLAASTSRRHAGLSIACCLAVTRPKLSGHRSSSTVLSQVCLGLPVLRRQSLVGPRMQARRVREWCWPVLARHRWPKKDKRRWQIVSDRSNCPVCDRTTSLETKSVPWIWRMRLICHWKNILGD